MATAAGNGWTLGGVHHVGLTVADLERSIAFYAGRSTWPTRWAAWSPSMRPPERGIDKPIPRRYQWTRPATSRPVARLTGRAGQVDRKR